MPPRPCLRHKERDALEISSELQNIIKRSKALLTEAAQFPAFDQVLLPILMRLCDLAYCPEESCCGHTLSDQPDRLDKNFCFISLIEDGNDLESIREQHEQIRADLPILEKAINRALVFANAVQITFEEDEFPEITIMFDIKDDHLARTAGRRVLATIWQEFYNFLEIYDHRHLPKLELRCGDVFIKKNPGSI